MFDVYTRACMCVRLHISALFVCASMKDEASNACHVFISTPKITIFRRSNATIFPYVTTCLAYHAITGQAMPCHPH